MKVKIKERPTGLLNGLPWPEVGELIDLPSAVAEAMESAGHVERVGKSSSDKVEKRPAATRKAEKRG